MAIIGCLVLTHGVVWPLILLAPSQSDCDRHIKMQILACALVAILSLPFSLCGVLRGKELESWPWGWIFKWPPDFPTEQHQPGFHLHSSLSPLTVHHCWLCEPQLSPRPSDRNNSSCSLPPATLSFYKRTSPPPHLLSAKRAWRSHPQKTAVENSSSLPLLHLCFW